MAGLPLGLTQFVPRRASSGPGAASADATGKVYTVSGLKPGSTAILYANGTPVTLQGGATDGKTTVDGTGKATWTFVTAPAAGTIMTYDGVITGSAVTATGGSTTPVSISGTPGAATVGTAYSFTPTVAGGSGTKSFSQSGTLPAGLSFSSSTGAITGSPTTVANYPGISITVSDSTGSATLGPFAITVNAAAVTLQALTLSPSTGTVGTAYSGTISGATAGSTIAVSGAGSAGLSVSGTGTSRTLAGTPTTAGAVDLTETLSGATNSPRTTSGLLTVSAAALINMTGAEPRVAITDASYWIRTSGTLARSTDTTYETNLKNSSANKTVPFPGNQTIPAGSIGYVMLRLPATTDASPPLFINWDGATAQPSAASPMLPTIWERTTNLPATGTGSPDDAGFAQRTDFAPYRPTAATDAAYAGRGQRHFHGVQPERIVMVVFDLTASGITQAVTPQVACSSGQWMWVVGMSIIRNQYSSISTVSASRSAVISAAGSSADPFFFVSARSGANQQAILDEQVTPISNSAALRRFVRGIYANFWINDLAFSSVRPYSTASQSTRDGIGSRSQQILSTLGSLGLTLVASDCTYGNYGAATPAVNGDLSSANGNLPWITNVLGPVHKAQLSSAFDPAYDWPWVSQYASMGETYDTNMADEVHPNGTGYTAYRTNEAPSWKMLYGQAAGQNSMQRIIAALGSSTTTAKKTRAQAVFDALAAGYPTSNTTASNNRATLRAQLDGLTAS